MQTSPQELARHLLREALQQLEKREQWETQNRRRVELIKKSTNHELTQAELQELQSLQDEADRRLEARDRQLLNHSKSMNEMADNPLGATDND